MRKVQIVILAILLVFNLQTAFTQDIVRREKNWGFCSVSGAKASEDYNATYKGKIYYFCCQMCAEEFKKDPEKYASKIKEIKLETYQFGFSPDPIIVKKGDIVRLEITSRDVTHGVYIKKYGINLPIERGEHKRVEFIADKEGEFSIVCSVYCGSGHSSMRGRLIVEK